MSDIYIVLLEDRHIDVDAYPFLDRQQAIEYAQVLVHANARHPENIDWGGPLDQDMIADGWVYYVEYSSESDCVRVIQRTLDATP